MELFMVLDIVKLYVKLNTKILKWSNIMAENWIQNTYKPFESQEVAVSIWMSQGSRVYGQWHWRKIKPVVEKTNKRGKNSYLCLDYWREL